jgi:sulfur-oxidizing protein SoxZ
MASPMKIRAQMKGDTADVKILMAHPMETGQRKDSAGKIIPAHHITMFTVEVGGKVVVQSQTGPSVSTNPVFGFKVKAKAGDKVVVKWQDNKGDSRTDEAVVS